MEIELKLSLPESAQRRFLGDTVLRQASGKHASRLINIYYDTPDLALRRRGIALRLRRQNGAWLQTIKCAGQNRGGLSSRPEWEGPYGGAFDFSAVDDAGIRRWLEKPRTLKRLLPVFETNFRRTTWRYDGVLVMLDRGWIAAAGRREAISELELELDGGNVDGLLGLAERMALRVPLVPAMLSKAERGYNLYLNLSPAPAKAESAISCPAPQSPISAFKSMAFACTEHLQRNHAGAVNSDDPEYVHQMRVATRRLRACVRIFAPLLPAGFIDAILPPLRALTNLLGHVRDLDVLLEEITAPVTTALPTEPRLAALAGIVTERRYHARTQAARHLAAPEYGQAALRILVLLYQLAETGVPSLDLDAFSADRLRRLRRKVRRLAAAASPDDPVSLHTLRIAVKRLRYALEFFAPIARSATRQRLAAQLAEAQTTLGQLNDLANAGRLLMDCAGEDLRLREAVTLIGGWHGPRHAALMGKLPALLDDLTRLPRLT